METTKTQGSLALDKGWDNSVKTGQDILNDVLSMKQTTEKHRGFLSISEDYDFQPKYSDIIADYGCGDFMVLDGKTLGDTHEGMLSLKVALDKIGARYATISEENKKLRAERKDPREQGTAVGGS